MDDEQFRVAVLKLAAKWATESHLGGYLFSPTEMMLQGAGPRRIRVTFEELPEPQPGLIVDMAGVKDYVVT